MRIRLLVLLAFAGCAGPPEYAGAFRIALFSADITPPVGHPLCGGMVAPAARIADPLSARGVVLWGAGEPVIVAALDWTELRNETYDAWRDALAAAAGTTRRRVLLSCVHQHDAPYADLGAQRRLDAVGLRGFHVDPAFHARALEAVAAAVRDAVKAPRRLTHLGMGEAEVERVASNRRVVLPDGRPTFKRYSRTADPVIRNAPEGLIDPKLKTLSFWDGEQALAALSFYAVHPMSRYGGGSVSADFPGLARERRGAATPGVLQIYLSGAAGDVTAAKYNDGDEAARRALAARLEAAMARAWMSTHRVALKRLELKVAELAFALPADGPASVPAMEKTLADPAAAKSAKLMAALGLSWSARTRPIEVPAIDFGHAQLLLLPAEAFVEFQLAAQRLWPDRFIAVAGYGECGPGYIPTEAARAEGYVEEHGYCWVAAGAEEKLRRAIEEALRCY